MRFVVRLLLSACLGLGVLLAAGALRHAWLLKDMCLDSGGRVLAAGWCQTADGIWAFEAHFSRSGALLFGTLGLVGGFVVGWITFRNLGRLRYFRDSRPAA